MLSSSSELTKTLLTRSELISLKDLVPNRSHTFACLIVKERWKLFASRLRRWRVAVSAVVVGAHSRDFRRTVNTFFTSFLSNGHLLTAKCKKAPKSPISG